MTRPVPHCRGTGEAAFGHGDSRQMVRPPWITRAFLLCLGLFLKSAATSPRPRGKMRDNKGGLRDNAAVMEQVTWTPLAVEGLLAREDEGTARP